MERAQTRIPTGMQLVKAILMKFQMETSTLSVIGLEATHVTFWQRLSIFCLCPETLRLNLKVMG
jgi:hypothetical protein